MNTWIKRAAAAAGIVAAIALPMSGLASDGTITFNGAVTASSCSIDVDGSGNGDGTVTLPTVDTAALTNGAAKTDAGGKFFYITLSGCSAASDLGAASPGGTAPTTVQIYFEAGPNVDETTGGLINVAAGGYKSNVEVKLYNASNSAVVGTQITPGHDTVQAPVQTIGSEAQQWFYAGYSTEAAATAATAGTVSTSVTYSIKYN